MKKMYLSTEILILKINLFFYFHIFYLLVYRKKIFYKSRNFFTLIVLIHPYFYITKKGQHEHLPSENTLKLKEQSYQKKSYDAFISHILQLVA